ncbi:MAG: VRR-NUC domain-containing protein, partial [Tissierellia bacterium]|nr:VRR-NUC domain-containing protein [Tissierellia bacterium]
LLSKGKIAFAELKAPGKKLRPLQEKRKRQLEELGFLVFEIDNANEIDEIIEEIAGGDAS